MTWEVHEGDSAEVLRGFAEASIDAVVTDPPHGLGFMGAQWDATLPAQSIFDECYRVLKPGGHILVMSSERVGCVAGLYMALKRAGFEVDESQLLCWVSLTGMPKSVDVAKIADKEAFRAWLAFVGAEVTPEERRKAESAAVGGCYSPEATRETGTYYYEAQGQERPWYSEQRSGDLRGPDLLTRLLTAHWPSSPAEQRAHWEAVLGEVPEGWDTSRPPGVRVKTGVDQWADLRKNFGYDAEGKRDGGDTWGDEKRNFNETAPSTPDACALEGRRASVAPLKPFCYPIIHAQKPCEGSYLANWRKWGTGPMGVGDARIPFADDADEASAEFGVSLPSGGDLYQGKPTSAVFDGPPRPANPAGRTPSNLLSYADLLGDLQRYCDLDAWCERLGLPDAAADLLEAGLVYAPKPCRAEKEAGLEGFEERAERPLAIAAWEGQTNGSGEVMGPCAPARNTHPTAKPAALCAYLVALATREGQTVLDPFCGSGSTGVACARIGRNFVGVELDADFAAIARARIAHAETTRPAQEALPL